MIRINLLPFRAARKKENIKRQLSIFGLTILLLVAVMAHVYLQKDRELSSLKDKEKQTQGEMAKYRKVLAEISRLEKEIKEIKTKLNVIKELERNKSGPVHLLDAIATAVPKEKLWLSSLSESGGSLSLTGTAMDNETVALFMNNLERSNYIHSVDLNSTRMRYLPEHKLRVSDFTLSCKTYADKEEQKTETKKGKKKRKK